MNQSQQDVCESCISAMPVGGLLRSNPSVQDSKQGQLFTMPGKELLVNEARQDHPSARI